jgi:hypothetical protein
MVKSMYVQKNNMPKNDEIIGWMKRLKNLQEENIRLKIALSGMIKRGVRQDVLSELETFHNRFLGIDSAISGIKLKISIQQLITEQEALYPDKTSMIAHKEKKLKLDISRIENDFSSLTEDFNIFIKDLPGLN